MIDRFGPGVGHLNYLAVPGVGIFEFLTTNHFLGWGISVIFDLAFLPGGREFDINFWENVKIPPYAPPPPRRLDIDRCIIAEATAPFLYTYTSSVFYLSGSYP